MPGEVIAVVGHELRRPLASIRGYTQMLLGHWDDFPEADKRAMLKEMHHEAERAGQLMDDLLDVSRLEAGQAPLTMRPVDIRELVARVVARLKVTYPVLEASVEIPVPLPPFVADPFRLEQVMGNIIENACQYGSPGTVRVTGGPRPSSSPPSGEAAPGVVEIAISDKGDGISPEDLPHVTEKFYRSANAQPGGLGLGLWISKSIIEAHGGELVASSVAGQGATVHFTIPLRRDGASGKLAGQ